MIFYTDFTEDRVGNFARGLKYMSGPVEVVERDGVKVLRATGRSEFLIPVGKRLPERFTLEIDVIAPPTWRQRDACRSRGAASWTAATNRPNVIWNPNGAWIIGSGHERGNQRGQRFPRRCSRALIGNVAHVRVLMDGAYFKMYVNERRMYNIPELAFRRDSVIRVALDGSEEDGRPST